MSPNSKALLTKVSKEAEEIGVILRNTVSVFLPHKTLKREALSKLW